MTTLAALAHDLSGRSNSSLHELLQLRPDAVVPPAANYSELAARLSSGPSISAALDHLNLPQLQALASGTLGKHGAGLHRLGLAVSAASLETSDAGPGHFPPLAAAVAAAGEALRTVPLTGCPTTVLAPVSATLRDNAAASAMAAVLRSIDALLRHVSAFPVATLKDGSATVHSVRAVSRALDRSEAEVAFFLDLGAMAGLLRFDPANRSWHTHQEFWKSAERPQQWILLVNAWLASSRFPHGRPLAPSGSAGTLDAGFALLRRRVLQTARLLSDAGSPGMVSPTALKAAMLWHYPRVAMRSTALLPGILADMELLGLTGAGAVSEPAMLLGTDSDGKSRTLESAVRALLPASIRHFMLQGDLTAIAPGHLAPEIAAKLCRMAAPEGRGNADIYRFSQASLKSALAAGMTRENIEHFLTTHASTAVPQTLLFLLAEADRSLLGEECTGEPVPQAPPARRAAECKPRPGVVPPAVSGADIDAQIERLRSNPVAELGSGPALVAGQLREAVAAAREVWVEAVDSSGGIAHVRLQPTQLDHGLLRGWVAGRGGELQRHSIAVHRIVGVREGGHHG